MFQKLMHYLKTSTQCLWNWTLFLIELVCTVMAIPLVALLLIRPTDLLIKSPSMYKAIILAIFIIVVLSQPTHAREPLKDISFMPAIVQLLLQDEDDGTVQEPYIGPVDGTCAIIIDGVLHLYWCTIDNPNYSPNNLISTTRQ